MTPWMTRAAVMIVLHAGLGVALEMAVTRWPEQGGWLRIVVLVALIVAALAWGTVDGTRAKRSWDDPAARWVKAGLAAGPVAGLIVFLVRVIALDATGLESLSAALFGGGAFTALLVLVPAIVGLLLGRWLVASPHKKIEIDPRPDDTENDRGVAQRVRSARNRKAKV